MNEIKTLNDDQPKQESDMIELILRRIISSILFIILVFSIITLIEVVVYTIRFLINRKPFPEDPYCFKFIERMWY